MNITITGNKIEVSYNSGGTVYTFPLSHVKWVMKSDINSKNVIGLRIDNPDKPYYEIDYADIVNVNGATKGTYDATVLLIQNAVLAYQNDDFNTISDESDATYYYFAKALPGTATTDAFWQCKRTLKVSPYTTVYADGNANFDNLGNDIKNLTYA